MSSDLVLVTGASGYVASCIVKMLLERDYRVRGTVRNLKDDNKVAPLRNLVENPKHPLELCEANLLDEKCWVDIVKDCTIVIHTASPFPNKIPEDENDLIKPAVDGTLNVLRACVAPGALVKRVVLTSSTAAICGPGNLINGKTYTEDDWLDVSRALPYDKSKTLAEKAAWNFIDERKKNNESCFELAVINPGLIMGPSQHNCEYTSMEIIKHLLEKQIPFLPNIQFPICDVRDVALAHIKAIEVPEAANHRHIIATAQAKSVQDFALILDAEFRPQGYSIPTRVVPNIFVRFASIFDKSLSLVTPYLGYSLKYDNSRMINVLKIEPIAMDKTIIDMAYDLIKKKHVKKP